MVPRGLRLSLAADQRNSAWINSQIQQAVPKLRIVRWAEYRAMQPSRMTQYLREGVHTTVPTSQDARNELMTQAILAV